MYSERKKAIIRNNERKGFRLLKEKENFNIQIPQSDDILYTSDFTFKNYSNNGDSGSLLLATNKLNKDKKYIVKHDCYDCACNEYMYSKIGNKMGIKIAPVKLFLIDDKEKTFKSDFVCGIKYFEECEKVNYNYVIENKENIKNWEDYFKFRGLESLFFESDGVEAIKYNDYIYRIDTTDAFTLSLFDIYPLAYDFEYEGVNVRKFAEKQIINKASGNTERRINLWKFSKKFFEENYDIKYLEYFLEPFYLLDKITDKDIDEWISVLCYFYPNVIGKYYKLFLKTLKEDVKVFLSEIEVAV